MDDTDNNKIDHDDQKNNENNDPGNKKSDDDNDGDESSSSSSSSTLKQHRYSCSICMERFQVGDTVSFSPSSNCCSHAFHHACIREWLLRRKGCPCCRVTMLPIDRKPPPTPPLQRFQRYSNTNSSNNNINNNNDNDDVENDEENRDTDEESHNNNGRRRFRPKSNNKNHPTSRKWFIEQQQQKLIRARTNRKCGTYFCMECGFIVLNKELREDLLPPSRIKTKKLETHNTTISK